MPTPRNQEIKFVKDLSYDRQGTITKRPARCDLCGKLIEDCLVFDTAAEEYGEISLCKTCLVSMFN